MNAALKAIKLSGFKSIVDPTSLNFKHMMTGIVGPNGCGKSNIMDAIRWVTGESSAKQLRGEALIDVIFNGTTQRQPVGQASVELVFDNQNGRLTKGQYGEYQEIALRRTLNREGQSQYYINDMRCRRRDIIDLLRGTGLGPRSYAIIEQGMISRLIEAKPDELRVFIEEVAGTAQYKDRRRETENRMRATRENLERLLDVQEELAKQLRHLQRQANAAEKYQVYQKELRLLKAERELLQWREQQATREHVQSNLSQYDAEHAKQQAEQAQCQRALVDLENKVSAKTEFVNEAQEQYYSIGTQIAQIEAKIESLQAARQAQQAAWQELTDQCAALDDRHAQDQAELDEVLAEIEQIDQVIAADKAKFTDASKALVAAETAMQQWQKQWADFIERSSEATQAVSLGRSRAADLEQQQTHVAQRAASIRGALEQCHTDSMQHDLNQVEQNLAVRQQDLEQLTERLHGVQSQREELRQQHSVAQESLHHVREQHASDNARLSSLEALQDAALKQEASTEHAQWLERKGWHEQSRLADQISVDEQWERAVETVLGPHLEAICVDHPVHDWLDEVCAQAQAKMIVHHDMTKASVSPAMGTLQAKVSGCDWVLGLLAHIYTADTVSDAMSRLATLAPHESVITPDGLWLSAHWVRVHAQDHQHHGVLERQRLMTGLSDRLVCSEAEIVTYQQDCQTTAEQLSALEQEMNQILAEQQASQSAVAQMQSSVMSLQAKIEQKTDEKARMQEQLTALLAEDERFSQDLTACREAQQLAVAKQQTVVEQRASLEQQQQSVEQTLHEAKSAEHQAKANVDQQLVRQQTLASQRHFLQRGLERLAAELAAQREKLEQLELQRSDGDEPLEAMRAELTQVVAEQAEQEQILSASRAELNIFADQKNELQQQQQSIDNQLSAIRESTESARIALQTAVVKLQTFEQNITEQGFLLEVLQEQLSEEAEYALWQEKIASQETRISRLGPINLAAIDEHKQVTERKEYLDQQQVDLESALGMLESAIEKIDKETRSLFRDTFNAINEEFQTLFPKVFSGGKAVLEMTENDLLKTGVIVRAQPPGKRNSTIHLLSGGEKALTALALVFSLFKSNPAPFCLLDEVDAPLDEANVGRFCHLVEEMAKEVQFIIVTHNKATMQRMHQLNGVTMREPGVTRLVSVDIAEAVELAEQN